MTKIVLTDPRFLEEGEPMQSIEAELTQTGDVWDDTQLSTFVLNGRTEYAGQLETENGMIWLHVSFC